MKTITFADHELDELKKFYQNELEKTVKRVEDLQGIIQKFSGQTPQTPVVEPAIESRTPVNRQTKTKRAKIKTISWRKFIPKLLKREERPLNIHDIANATMEKFQLTDREKITHSLSTTLARMTRMGILKPEKKEGEKINYYGLTSRPAETHVVAAKKENSSNGVPVTSSIKSRHAARNGKSKKQVVPWKKFIPQQIKEKGSLTIYDFADSAMKEFNYSDREKLMRTLSPTLSRMLKIGKLTFDRKPGQKTHLYGLPSVPARVKSKK